jgi:hypothetical protein
MRLGAARCAASAAKPGWLRRGRLLVDEGHDYGAWNPAWVRTVLALSEST